MVRSAAADEKKCRLTAAWLRRVSKPQTGPPSPSRRPLSMEYVIGPNLFARPPQAEGSSDHLDVLPKAQALGNRLHRRKRSLIAPRRAFVTRAIDHHVIELN